MRKFFVLLIPVILIFGQGCLTSSSSSGGGRKETVIIHQPARQDHSAVQQREQPPSRDIQDSPGRNSPSAVKNFAVKSYSKIDADNRNGGGEYLSSLVTLMESEGIPKDDALVFIKQALRKANGNAEVFGEQIEKFVE